MSITTAEAPRITHSGASLADDIQRIFDATGCAVARGFFPAEEVASMSRWIDALLERPEIPGQHWVYRQPSLLDPSRKVVQRIENFCPHHADFDRLCRDSRLTRAVEQLLGGPAVLFKEKINFKEPGGAGFELHQDQQAGWSRYAPLYVTAMVCVDAATIENGCLEITDEGRRIDHLIAEEWRPIEAEEMAGAKLRAVPTEPGDVIFFDSFFPHASKDNLTGERRRMLFITYNHARYGDVRDQYHRDKRASYPPDIEREAGTEYRFRV